MPETTTDNPDVTEARTILGAAGIDTVDAYPTVPHGERLALGAFRVVRSAVDGSVAVDAMVARRSGPVLERIAAAMDAMRAAGWSTVRLSPDAFRADPPEVAARLAEQERIRRRAWLTARIVELRAELADVTAELAALTD